MSMKLRPLALAVSCALVAVACSDSKDSPGSGGPAGTTGAGTDAGSPDASTLPDVPEPAWSGVTVEPGCTVNGCILELTAGSKLDQAILAGLASSTFTVDNGVQLYFIRYYSDGDEVSGTVFVPDSAPPAGGFPVVVMNQFTSGVGMPCAPSAGNLGIGVGGSTALHGILTIVPDAPSYGPPPIGLYLYAPQAGRAALDAARAAFHLTPAIGQPVARNAVIAGLSQGAHSTMAAASEQPGYAPHLEIRGFAAVAPPANSNATDAAFVKSDTIFAPFVAMRLFSWQRYFGLGTDPIFREPYASQMETWLSEDCIYNGSNAAVGKLDSHFTGKPSETLSDTFLGYFRTGAWPDGWAKAIEAATPIPKAQTAPIVIFQGSSDVIVPKTNTDAYVAELRAAGLTIDYRVIDGGTHGATALSSFTVAQSANDQAYAWIHDHLAP